MKPQAAQVPSLPKLSWWLAALLARRPHSESAAPAVLLRHEYLKVRHESLKAFPEWAVPPSPNLGLGRTAAPPPGPRGSKARRSKGDGASSKDSGLWQVLTSLPCNPTRRSLVQERAPNPHLARFGDLRDTSARTAASAQQLCLLTSSANPLSPQTHNTTT